MNATTIVVIENKTLESQNHRVEFDGFSDFLCKVEVIESQTGFEKFTTHIEDTSMFSDQEMVVLRTGFFDI